MESLKEGVKFVSTRDFRRFITRYDCSSFGGAVAVAHFLHRIF
jgi:hypothetical protein